MFFMLTECIASQITREIPTNWNKKQRATVEKNEARKDRFLYSFN